MKKLINRNRLLYITIFCFFFLILTLSPLSGDDWGNYLVGKIGLRNCFEQALGMYFTWEGRLVSRVFINLLTYNKIIWNIINSLLITEMIYSIVKMIKPKNKITVLCLVMLSILLMNIYTFSQVVVWIAGNITYLFPLAFIIFYLLDIKNSSNKSSNMKILLLTIFNLVVPMFVEHMAVLLVLINLIFLLIKYYKIKKIDRNYLMYTIISIFSTLLMFISPGTRLRSEIENIEFNQLNIFHKVLYNFPNFIYYTFIINSFLLILLEIANIYRIIKLKKNKYLKMILSLYLSIIPVITIIIYNLSQFIKVSPILLLWINQNSMLIGLYWLSYLLIYFYLVLNDLKTSRGKWNVILSILAITSNIIMLASPTWGYRTSLATYLILIIPQIEVMDRIKINKLIEKIIIVITIMVSLAWLVFYINIRVDQSKLEKKIASQLKENKPIIEIDSFPAYANCNINPTNPYHLEIFKKYYQIPPEKEVVLIPNHWRYIIMK
ncbi:MAG: DUF6056 family protein [bacterium]|nr:DUF6056 family protein [bacterium]